ncbi:hypothetical protein KIPB_012537, partial [Kipferlia bialata]
ASGAHAPTICIPMQCPLSPTAPSPVQYVSFLISHPSSRCVPGMVSVGVAKGPVARAKHVGEYPGSCGIQSTGRVMVNGHSHREGAGFPDTHRPGFVPGDVVGVGYVRHLSLLFFTRNHTLVAALPQSRSLFTGHGGMSVPGSDLFVCVSVRAKDVGVEIVPPSHPQAYPLDAVPGEAALEQCLGSSRYTSSDSHAHTEGVSEEWTRALGMA